MPRFFPLVLDVDRARRPLIPVRHMLEKARVCCLVGFCFYAFDLISFFCDHFLSLFDILLFFSSYSPPPVIRSCLDMSGCSAPPLSH